MSSFINKSSNDSTKDNRINYAEHVQKPGDVTKMKNFFSIIFNVRDAFDYAKSSLINGYDCQGKSLVLGDKFFVESGNCGKDSDQECQGKPRYLYFDNVPQNIPPCVNPNQPVHSRCRTNQNSGIIPGILQDSAELNPFELMYSSTGNGSKVNTKCVLRREKVGYQSGDKQRYHYETKCAPKRSPLICSIKSSKSSTESNIENFIDQHVQLHDITDNDTINIYYCLLFVTILILCTLLIIYT